MYSRLFLPFCSHDNSDQKIETGAGQLVAEEIKVKKPKLYKVLIHNDDYTTMEFVIFILQKIFHLTYDQAYQIMLKVHKEGVGVCGIFTFEIAENKYNKVVQLAKEKGHPLRCTMEEE